MSPVVLLDSRSVEEFVKRQFMRAVVRDVSDETRVGVHVTDIVYDCLRRAYYQIMLRGSEFEVLGMKEDDYIYTWIGRKLHETDFSELHEFEVEFNDVKGTVDEVFKVGDAVVVVDKKSTRKVPPKPYEHHVKQVCYYGFMLDRLGVVSGKHWFGCILYIDVNSGTAVPMAFEFKPSDYAQEFVSKSNAIHEALSKRMLPSANVGWVCNYCSYVGLCMRDKEVGSK